MKQIDLINAFHDGAVEGDALSLHIVGNQLIHYNTAILERFGEQYILNYTHYSLATGKVQKMITDAIDDSDLIYVSCVPSETRRSLVDFLSPKDGGEDNVPGDYLMEIEHASFGHGYVTAITSDLMECHFGKQTKTLMYPLTIENGIAKIIEDHRANEDANK